MTNQKRIQKALDFIKEGEGHLKTGLFKWKPDYQSAAPFFEKAANTYRGLEMFEEAAKCFCRAGECFEFSRLNLPAARDFEHAVENYQQAKKWKEMEETATRACGLFEETTQEDRIPGCLIKKAIAYENIDKKQAMKSYKIAIDKYVEMKKTMNIGENIDKAISFGLKNELFDETIEFLESATIAHLSMKLEREACKDRLTQILILFIQKKFEDIQMIMNDGMQCFIESDQQICAFRFIDCYQNAKVKAFAKLKNDPIFTFLNPELVYRVKEIEIPQEIIDKVEEEKKKSKPSGPIQFNEDLIVTKEVVKTDEIQNTQMTHEQMKAFEKLTSNLPFQMGEAQHVVNAGGNKIDHIEHNEEEDAEEDYDDIL